MTSDFKTTSEAIESLRGHWQSIALKSSSRRDKISIGQMFQNCLNDFNITQQQQSFPLPLAELIQAVLKIGFWSFEVFLNLLYFLRLFKHFSGLSSLFFNHKELFFILSLASFFSDFLEHLSFLLLQLYTLTQVYFNLLLKFLFFPP